MGAIRAVVTLTAVAMHGLIELLQDRKLITGIFFTDFQFVGSAHMGFGERIAVVAAGGDTYRHGIVNLVLWNLP